MRTVQRSAFCRSRRELSNECLLAKIGVDTAENELLENWGKIQNSIHYSFASLMKYNIAHEHCDGVLFEPRGDSSPRSEICSQFRLCWRSKTFNQFKTHFEFWVIQNRIEPNEKQKHGEQWRATWISEISASSSKQAAAAVQQLLSTHDKATSRNKKEEHAGSRRTQWSTETAPDVS